MKFQEAKAILSGPLRFGDDLQLEAKLYFENLESARLALARCRICSAEGVVRRGRPPRRRNCTCIERFGRDVIETLGVEYIGLEFAEPTAAELGLWAQKL
jgi:hypothetical protein